MLRVILVFCILLIVAKSSAQQYAFRELSLKQGLPQSQVKAINQDKDGFLWVGTLGGLARFDGEKFDVYSSENGLLNNRVIFLEFVDDVLFVGHENGISIMSALGKFASFSVKNFPENVRFSHVVKFKNRTIVSTNGQGLFEFSGSKLVPLDSRIVDPDELGEFQRIRKMAVFDNKLFFATRGGVYYTSNLKDYQLIPETEDWSVSDLKSTTAGIAITNYNEATYLISFRSSGEAEFDPLHSSPSAALLFQDGVTSKPSSFWLLSEQNQILRNDFPTKSPKKHKNEEFLIDKSSGLPSEIITTFFIDFNGVVWIGTEGKGLYQFLGEAFTKYDLSAPVLTLLREKSTDDLWCGTLNGGLININRSASERHFHPELKDVSVWCSLKDKKGNLWFGTSKGVFSFQSGTWKYWNTENQNELPNNRISALFEDPKGTIWIGTKQGVAFFKGGELKTLKSQNKVDLQIIRDFEFSENNLIIATKSNLYRYNILTESFAAIDVDNKNASFSCLHVDKKNRIWVGSEEGLYTIQDNKLQSFKYTEISAERFVNFISGFGEKLIIGTNNGIFELSDVDLQLNQFNLRHYDESYGLTSAETNLKAALFESSEGGKLWFGTSDGLFEFNPKKLNTALDVYKPKLFLSDFQVNFSSHSASINDEEFELKHNQNRLRFMFQVLDLYQMDKVKLEYRLNENDAWIESGNNSEIVFNQLASGSYVLHVRAVGGNGNSSDVLQFNFIILKPFYASWWFILLVVLALGLVALSIVRYRINQIRTQETQERLELNNRLNSLEQQSLNASMNRHFIFNALNSIQYFINTQDKLSANKYLSKFAQLIRKNLDSSASGENSVSLSEEIQRLNLYLSLESMRFEGRFEFILDIDDEIDQEEIKLPAMLFQPFIENAIIHGVLPNESALGKIVFTAKKVDGQIVFTITDNGVGYSTSLKEKNGNGDHFSHGTSITRSRIEVIRKISGDVISMDGPLDLFDEMGKITGTKVEIKILDTASH